MYSNNLDFLFTGSMDKKKKNVGTGLVGAPACGDVMKLQFEVDDNNTVVDAKFKTFGCGSAIASSSYGKKVFNCFQITLVCRLWLGVNK